MIARDAEVVRAEYGVPHVKFERTEQGFVVTYKRGHVAIQIGIAFLYFILGMAILLGCVAVGEARSFPLGGLVTIAIGISGIVLIWKKTRKVTSIICDRDFITIDDKKMSRNDFGHFSVYESGTLTIGKASHTIRYAQLGYQFGNRSFPIPGSWSEREASEIASALNVELQNSPRGERPSPTALRNERPTEF